MDSENDKGCFKDFPPEVQPERIPLSLYDKLAEYVLDSFGHLGKMYIPNAHKKSFGKITTGDMDIVFVPNNYTKWVDDILRTNIILAYEKNGPQLMTVIQFEGVRYMVDFLLTKPEDFEWKKMYVGFGTLIPAVIGSFARSLRYKFAMDGFYIRLCDSKGNYHNIKLTSDPKIAINILDLDPDKLDTDELYTAEGVANWVIKSDRFDSEKWNQPPAVDGQTIVTKNRKSHAAAKKRDEVIECYDIIDKAVKVGIFNTDYNIERVYLGNEFIDNILKQAEEVALKGRSVLDGKEIMTLLNIQEGSIIGEVKRFLLSQPEFENLTQEQLDSPEIKKQAKNMVKFKFKEVIHGRD